MSGKLRLLFCVCHLRFQDIERPSIVGVSSRARGL